MDHKDCLTTSYQDNIQLLNAALRVDENFDVIARNVKFAKKSATFYFIDGFVKDDIMEKIMEYTMGMKVDDFTELDCAQAFAQRFIPYVEVDTAKELSDITINVLSGIIALMIEGYEEAILIDARTYPARDVAEPDDDRVLRGSRDGFVETLVLNTALIRRRIRDANLTMDILKVGSKSQTDVVVCYLKGKADEISVQNIKNKLCSITIPALTLSQESLAECLNRKQLINPFPRIRYTERPDAATASVLEGSILILVDNTPAVMILPTTLLDFVQDTNDYYFPPVVGTYLRLVRITVFLLTIFLTPVWYLLISNPSFIPPWLSFIQITEMNEVPIIVQLLIIEFVVDGLKLASLNTPDVLSNSFSVVGALILGDFAVKARWFVPEVVLYMAFVAIANFTQPSFELGYAMKFFRILLLVLTALFQIWGFIAGILIMFLMALFTRTIDGGSYLYR